jgi:hypothetical protein
MNTPVQSSLVRAKALVDMASKTEGIHSDLVAFSAARLLREEGVDAKVCSQVLFHTDHNTGSENVSNQVMLCVEDKLVDEMGVYEDTQQMTHDRLVRWRLKTARVDEFPYNYELDGEDDEIYAGWGVSPQEFSAMVDLLKTQDCAARMQQRTPKTAKTTKRKRL